MYNQVTVEVYIVHSSREIYIYDIIKLDDDAI